MIEKIIKGIKYRLDEENLTAEVIQKKGYEGDIIIPEAVVLKEVAYCVTSIGKGAFIWCDSLTSIVIPDGVMSIGLEAFSGCSSLTSMVIPDGVTSIGKWAFRHCSSLTSITFNGTKAQWNRIKLGDNWKGNWKLRIAAQRVHCTDGKVKI